MTITDIKIRKQLTEGKMKAIVSVTFDEVFAVHDIRVIDNDGKEFVAMPSRRMPDGVFRDIAHPINSTFRNELESIILERYHQEEQAVGTEKDEGVPQEDAAQE